MTAYAELAVTSNFSFLRGASHPEELVATAAGLGYQAIAIADRNSVAGVVRAHVVAKAADIQLLVGVRLVLRDGFETLCFPESRAAYGRLTKLLTKGNRRIRDGAEKGTCDLGLDDLDDLKSSKKEEGGHVFIAMPPDDPAKHFSSQLERLSQAFPGQVFLAATRLYRGNDEARISLLEALSQGCAAPLVATNDVHYHAPNRRPLQDVITCIREHCTIRDAGFRLNANAERHLKPPAEIARIFKGHSDAVARTIDIARRCRFSLDELAYEYPDEPVGESATPQEELERLTWIGASQRFPGGPDAISEKLRQTIEHELHLIAQLGYAPYFLTVNDIVRYARDREILCQGRGSAANSAVCFCLGITSVNPTEIDLLFERFVSTERDEPPDIDVDFEHERREEVIQYIYDKYGRHRAGIAATVVTYRARSAIREVGKAMGLSLDMVSALASNTSWRSSREVDPERVKETGVDMADATLAQTLTLTRELIGFPRHLSQHVGGFIITRGPLDEVIPIANAAMADRTYVEWDKNDLDALNILKIDVLALGMLTCIRKAFGLLADHYGKDYNLATVPTEDPRVYDMICKADTIGVFQIESRAQMSMLPRLKPRNFYDLVIEIALVRPGPIQGDMVHPYLRRRQGLEAAEFPSKELEDVLGKTLGIPLFQEQAMKIAIVGAGFSPGEADQLRRAMATFKRTGEIGNFRDRFVDGMTAKGYQPDFAERCFKQIEGFSDYGFPESHSASFALLAYISSWLKCHHPDVFACALLNSLPMGFYSSASIVRDFREHDGEVRGVDINFSNWNHSLESDDNKVSAGTHALRLGFRQIKGFGEDDARKIEAARKARRKARRKTGGKGFDSLRDLYFQTGLPVRVIEQLARADAFRSLGLDRRDAVWAVQGLGTPTGERSAVEDLPLYAAALERHKEENSDNKFIALQREQEMALPTMALGEHVTQDYATLKLSLKAHPVSFLRPALDRRGYVCARALATHPVNKMTSIAGLVLVRQRPGTARGVIFATLEDETGVANVIIWPKTFETNRKTVLGARCLGVRGMLQREQSVVHIIAKELIDLGDELRAVMDETEDGEITVQNPNPSVLPKGRNFH